jgi:hypothetical protein
MNDRITFLRLKYASAINAKENELEALRDKLALLDELEADSSGFEGGDQKPNGESNGHENKRTAPIHTGMTEAAFEAMKKLGAGHWTDTAAVREHMIKSGFTGYTKNFTIQLGTTLKRLTKQKRLKTRTHLGSRQFKMVDSP